MVQILLLVFGRSSEQILKFRLRGFGSAAVIFRWLDISNLIHLWKILSVNLNGQALLISSKSSDGVDSGMEHILKVLVSKIWKVQVWVVMSLVITQLVSTSILTGLQESCLTLTHCKTNKPITLGNSWFMTAAWRELSSNGNCIKLARLRLIHHLTLPKWQTELYRHFLLGLLLRSNTEPKKYFI